MKQHLLLFSISPVQAFITNARKTQDLYAASSLLSAMVQAGLQGIADTDIVFPVLPEEAKSAPNRLVVKVAATEVTALAEQMETRVWEYLQSSAKSARKRAGMNGASLAFDAQLAQHFSFFWAAVPLGEDYAASLNALENQLARQKNVRNFQQFNYQADNPLGERGRKCSIEPGLNALVYRPFRSEGSSRPPKFMAKAATAVEHDILDRGENLSALGLLKRFHRRQGTASFPSTAEIALLAELSELDDRGNQLLTQLKQCFDKDKVHLSLVELIQEGKLQSLRWPNPEEKDQWVTHFDYQACFAENLRAKLIPNPFQLHLLQKIQRELEKQLKTRYYAIIQFDGDKMGKRLEAISAKGEAQHRAFSEALAKFAAQASSYLDDNGYGRTVYAGGDDFLGFVNIRYLFRVMNHLRESFGQAFGLLFDAGESPSFSAGIMITHYKIPLHEVLASVRRLEKKAKHETAGGGRNAFCISTIKHSGEVQEAFYKWGDSNANWKALQTLVDLVTPQQVGKAAAFSPKFIQLLSAQLVRLGGRTGAFSDHNLLLSEAQRLLLRSKANDTTDQQVSDGLAALKKLWMATGDLPHGSQRSTNFLHALHIADFISRKTRSQDAH